MPSQGLLCPAFVQKKQCLKETRVVTAERAAVDYLKAKRAWRRRAGRAKREVTRGPEMKAHDNPTNKALREIFAPSREEGRPRQR